MQYSTNFNSVLPLYEAHAHKIHNSYVNIISLNQNISYFSWSCLSQFILQLTSLLAEIGLNIQEAHAFSTLDGYSLDVFVVDGWPYEVHTH